MGSRIILHNSVLWEGSCSEWDQPLTFSVVVSYLDFLWTLGQRLIAAFDSLPLNKSSVPRSRNDRINMTSWIARAGQRSSHYTV